MDTNDAHTAPTLQDSSKAISHSRLPATVAAILAAAAAVGAAHAVAVTPAPAAPCCCYERCRCPPDEDDGDDDNDDVHERSQNEKLDPERLAAIAMTAKTGDVQATHQKPHCKDNCNTETAMQNNLQCQKIAAQKRNAMQKKQQCKNNNSEQKTTQEKQHKKVSAIQTTRAH